jgi:methylated-DNA-[protein]-cysteine S-methyltransferase
VRTHTTLDSPVGPLTLVNADGVLCGLYLQGQAHHPDPAGFGTATETGFGPVRAELAEYFAGARTTFTVPLAPVGSAFELRVWGLLRTIPYGETRSYGQLAEQLGDRGLARAVGAANGHNPISVIVPCHRVVGADGSLTGYAGGLHRKEQLLALEDPSRAVQPTLFGA